MTLEQRRAVVESAKLPKGAKLRYHKASEIKTS